MSRWSRKSEPGEGEPRQLPANSRRPWGIVVAVLAVVALCWAGLGQDRQRQLGQNVLDASAAVQDKVSSARASARNAGLEQQVGARLRDEKTLDAAKIEVHVEIEGTAHLKGVVLDDAAKEKAVDLARNTRGVNQVVDHLAVQPPARVIDAASDADASTADAASARVRR